MQQPYKIPQLAKPPGYKHSKYLRALLSAGRVLPQLSHVRSERLRTIPRTVLARVLRLHKRMGHAPEDVHVHGCGAQEGETTLAQHKGHRYRDP